MPLPKLPEILKPCTCSGPTHDPKSKTCQFGQPGEALLNPEKIYRLPLPLQARVIEQLKTVLNSLGGGVNVPADPVSLAISKPKYSWMDTAHLRYLGLEVATCVEESGADVVCMPPRHAKTHTCSVWTPFWYLAKNPENQVFFISYEANFARKWGGKVRGLIELHGEEYNLRLNPKKTASDDWELVSGGGMHTIGVGGGIGGKPAKLLIVDDPLKNQEEANSQLQRDNIWDWWESTVLQRIEPDTAVIVIGTRYHEDDLIGRILKHSESGDGHHFNNITLRAKAEADDPLGRSLGEGLWTDHPAPGGVWGQEFYDGREATVSPYTWQSVYQQRPSPPGGNLVDPEWWQFYLPSQLPSSFDQEIQSWDLALDSKKETDSYMCGGVASRKNALVYIRDGFHEHCDINRVIDTIIGWNRIYPGAKTKLIERAISGPAVVQSLRHRVSGLVAWPPKGRQKESKESCLNACVPDIRSGNVLLPLRPDGTKPKWVVELIEELRTFPRSAHNDWVDMVSQALGFLLPSSRQALDRDHELAKLHSSPLSPVEAHTAFLHRMVHTLGDKKLKQLQERDDLQGRLIQFRQSAESLIASRGNSGRRLRGMW